MTNVATGTDVYSVSKIKTSQGRQGEAWSATLLRNGKAVASVINEACGGCLIVYWIEPDGSLLNPGNGSEEEARFNAHVEAEKAKIPASEIDEENSVLAAFDVQIRSLFNADICIENMVNKALDDRRWKRLCKTNTLFQVGKKIGSPDIQILKGATREAREWVVRKFPGEKIRFLNDEYP